MNMMTAVGRVRDEVSLDSICPHAAFESGLAQFGSAPHSHGSAVAAHLLLVKMSENYKICVGMLLLMLLSF